MKKLIVFLFAISVMAVALSVILNRLQNFWGWGKTERIEISEKRDTVVLRDTVWVKTPPPREVKQLARREKLVCVADSGKVTELGDSISVAMTVESKRYEGEDYEAWVSGVEAQLDSIRIFRKSEAIRHEVLKTEVKSGRKPSRWSIGITAGIGISRGRAGPFIGIGVSYRLF